MVLSSTCLSIWLCMWKQTKSASKDISCSGCDRFFDGVCLFHWFSKIHGPVAPRPVWYRHAQLDSTILLNFCNQKYWYLWLLLCEHRETTLHESSGGRPDTATDAYATLSTQRPPEQRLYDHLQLDQRQTDSSVYSSI